MATGIDATTAPDAWDGNQDTFAPPKTQRVIRGWDRAAVSAHAPRLQGHKVWKKPGKKTSTKQYDENEAQLELSKEGAGSRKKSRMVGAKENINPAVWDKKIEQASSITPRAALTPNGRKANLDIPRSIDKGAVSPAQNSSADPALQFVPRKRTNNNHIISPRKNMRQTTLNREAQRQSIAPSDSPAKNSRPKKAARKSGRRSSLGLLHHIETPQAPEQPAMKEQATFDYQVDSPLDSQCSASKPSPYIEAVPAASIMTPPVLQTPKSLTTKSDGEKSVRRSARPSRSAKKSPTKKSPTKKSPTKKSPTKKSDVPKTPSAACSAIDALLNSPGEAPPTLDRVQKLSTMPILSSASPKAKLLSPVKTIVTPIKDSPESARKAGISPSEVVSPVADNMKSESEAGVFDSTVVEVSAEVELSVSETSRNLDQKTVAEELEDVATAVETTMKAAQAEPVAATTILARSIEGSMVDISTEVFVSAAEVEDEFTREVFSHHTEEDESNDSSELSDLKGEDFTIMNALIPSEQVVEDEKSLEEQAEITTEQAVVSSLDESSEDHSDEATPSDEITEPLRPEDESVFMSPSQQLHLDLDTEIAKSPGKLAAPDLSEFEIEQPKPATETVAPVAATIPNYDQEDTDMLLNFVSRVREGKKAATVAPKRKRSLPHSPLKLPLGSVDEEGSLSPTPNGEFDLDPLPTGSPSKRRRTAKGAKPEEEVTPRRSTRTRLPVKSALPPPGAPSFIPVRRLGGIDHNDDTKTLTVKRTEDKEVAALTRVNTRKNKGGSVMPLVLLAKKAEEKEDPAMRQRLLKEVFDERAKKQAKGKKLNVKWAEELAQFQEFGETKAAVAVSVVLGGEKAKKVGGKKEKTASVVEKEEVPVEGITNPEDSKRRVRVGVRSKIALGMAANGTPAPKRKGGRGKA